MTDTTRDAFDEFVQSQADTHGNYVGDHYALWQAATEIATLAERERIKLASPDLTASEISHIHNALIVAGHDESDFEPECPACTAFQKITVFLDAAEIRSGI